MLMPMGVAEECYGVSKAKFVAAMERVSYGEPALRCAVWTDDDILQLAVGQVNGLHLIGLGGRVLLRPRVKRVKELAALRASEEAFRKGREVFWSEWRESETHQRDLKLQQSCEIVSRSSEGQSQTSTSGVSETVRDADAHAAKIESKTSDPESTATTTPSVQESKTVTVAVTQRGTEMPQQQHLNTSLIKKKRPGKAIVETLLQYGYVDPDEDDAEFLLKNGHKHGDVMDMLLWINSRVYCYSDKLVLDAKQRQALVMHIFQAVHKQNVTFESDVVARARATGIDMRTLAMIDAFCCGRLSAAESGPDIDAAAEHDGVLRLQKKKTAHAAELKLQKKKAASAAAREKEPSTLKLVSRHEDVGGGQCLVFQDGRGTWFMSIEKVDALQPPVQPLRAAETVEAEADARARELGALCVPENHAAELQLQLPLPKKSDKHDSHSAPKKKNMTPAEYRALLYAGGFVVSKKWFHAGWMTGKQQTDLMDYLRSPDNDDSWKETAMHYAEMMFDDSKGFPGCTVPSTVDDFD